MADKLGVLKLFDGLSDDDYLDVDEIARRFGKCPRTIKRWAARGNWPWVSWGNKNIIRAGALRALIMAGEAKTAARGRRAA